VKGVAAVPNQEILYFWIEFQISNGLFPDIQVIRNHYMFLILEKSMFFITGDIFTQPIIG
jgi:hypothetical protein